MTNLIVLLLVAVAATAVQGQNLVAPRIIGGVPIDTLRRFPHHVTIQPERYYPKDSVDICGGSILNEQWILTSARCVDQSRRLQLHFEKLYLNDTVGSYSAVVNDDAIRIYPTYYDDIALVKVPFRMIFSDIIKAVNISSADVSSLQNKLTVLPGFDTVTCKSPQLTYGMFNIISSSECGKYYKPDDYDEFLQLCAVGWSNNANAPCLNDQGSGLIVGWPARSELVGIYSSGSNCGDGYPAVYTNVAKYASWINSVISV